MWHQPIQTAFHRANRTADRLSVSVVGLGYVGAVNTARLAGPCHRAADIFVRDTRLTLSPCHLNPGFAFDQSRLLEESAL